MRKAFRSLAEKGETFFLEVICGHRQGTGAAQLRFVLHLLDHLFQFVLRVRLALLKLRSS